MMGAVYCDRRRNGRDITQLVSNVVESRERWEPYIVTDGVMVG
jgi:hypothetical protein